MDQRLEAGVLFLAPRQPFKIRLIGSTDSIRGWPEENFFGKHSGAEPSASRWENVMLEVPSIDVRILGWEQTAAGYAAPTPILYIRRW